MPHKYNADRRHRIPRSRYKVTNWRDYEAGLRQRGSLTIWFTEEAIAAWRAAPRTTPGGQARYSDLAIETSYDFRVIKRTSNTSGKFVAVFSYGAATIRRGYVL
jgi:heme-degrading monooxygenase HmoA